MTLQRNYHSSENDELYEERIKVNQQERKTPGRRGEKIKLEEIDKEFVRREKIKNERIPTTVLGKPIPQYIKPGRLR